MTGIPRQVIGDAANGNQLPSANVVVTLDQTLQSEGELIRLWKAAKLEKTAEDLDRSLPAGSTQEGPTDRRSFFEFTAAGMLAAETYRQRSGVRTDPLTLDELDDSLNQYATQFTSTPHHQLAPEIAQTWRSAETLLGAGVRARAQVQLTRIAGFASYYLGRLAFNVGDGVASRRLIRLAAEHAREIDDPILTGSVYGMRSTLAFYGHRYGPAADLARRGRALADHPYISARLASYEARALVGLGDEEGARAALMVMRQRAVDGPPLPGESPYGSAHVEQTTARTLALLGHGEAAEPVARASVETYQRVGGGFEDHGNAVLNLSWALLLRPKPEPEEAALLASRVVTMLDRIPTFSVSAKVADVSKQLDRFAELAAVKELREQLVARPRLALDP